MREGKGMNFKERTRKLALLLGVVCSSGVVVAAQAKPAADHTKVSLDLGAVTVWLGMPQAEALTQLQSDGYQVLGSGELKIVRDGIHVIGTISFKDQRVVFASLSWLGEGIDVMDATLAALEKISSNGAKSCSVSHEPNSTPVMSFDQISIKCGERSVTLGQIKSSSSVLRETDGPVVTENIGHLP